MSKFRSVVALAATAAGVATGTVLAPTPASAANAQWKVNAYSGSTLHAKAYGDFANNGGVYATVGINYVDMLNNGNPVYVEVHWSFWRTPVGSSTPVWYPEKVYKQTDRTERMKYVPTSLSKGLRGDSNKVRATIKVCEDRPHNFDICSDPAIVAFDY
ncbi:hypothetical protein [Amycolatopsis benzoatilytica]|uniref:hypothetical protein n=1 Tax=Amycolatopsis benzoatilytica TaxID=346045 RepID=UPI00036163AD|nr:hypothetical protein [Amycolatopsis benzoatilytica]